MNEGGILSACACGCGQDSYFHWRLDCQITKAKAFKEWLQRERDNEEIN